MLERLNKDHVKAIYFFPSGWSSLLASLLYYPPFIVFLIYNIICIIRSYRKRARRGGSEELPSPIRVMGVKCSLLWFFAIIFWFVTAISDGTLTNMVFSTCFYVYMFFSRFLMYRCLDHVYDWTPLEEGNVRFSRIAANIYAIVFVHSGFLFMLDLVTYMHKETGLLAETCMYFALGIFASLEVIVTIIGFLFYWFRFSIYRTTSYVIVGDFNIAVILLLLIIDGYSRSRYFYDFSTIMFYVIIFASLGTLKLFLAGCVCCCSSRKFEERVSRDKVKKRSIKLNTSDEADTPSESDENDTEEYKLDVTERKRNKGSSIDILMERNKKPHFRKRRGNGPS